jgi:hypothetical protein
MDVFFLNNWRKRKSRGTQNYGITANETTRMPGEGGMKEGRITERNRQLMSPLNVEHGSIPLPLSAQGGRSPLYQLSVTA